MSEPNGQNVTGGGEEGGGAGLFSPEHYVQNEFRPDVTPTLWSWVEYHGVQLVAVASGPTISIRDPYTFSVISILHDHLLSICSLEFATGNALLACASPNLITVHVPNEQTLFEQGQEANGQGK